MTIATQTHLREFVSPRCQEVMKDVDLMDSSNEGLGIHSGAPDINYAYNIF